MRNLPLVTIVTPAYNQAEYLAETIDSVLAQDYPNLEYIVLDDGSTDNTSAILQRYDGRIRHERHVNMGQANTLNRGWAMSKGLLIGYLSSDDRLKENAVSSLVHALLKRPDAVVAYCDFNLIDARGHCFRNVKTEDFCESRLCLDLVCQPGPGALFRREVFDHTSGWDANLRQVPDFDFWIRVSKFGKFIRIPEVLADYRIHKDSASVRKISEERAEEIVVVTKRFWLNGENSKANIATSNALFISAKHHFTSDRYQIALKAIFIGISKNPNSIISFKFWNLIISGLFRKLFYKLLLKI